MADNRVSIVLDATGSEAVAKVFSDLAAKGQQFAKNVVSGAHEAEGALNSLGTSAKRVFEIFTGVSLAGVFDRAIHEVKSFVTEISKLGLEALVQEDAYARFTKSVGVNGDVLLRKLEEVSRGVINSSDIMISAVRSLQEGLQPEQIVRLMTIAAEQSKIAGKSVADTFNAMGTAIANQSEKQLKSIGINIDMKAALERTADALGTQVQFLNDAQKAQAIFNEVSAKSQVTIDALATSSLSLAQQIEKLGSQWKQVKEDLGKLALDNLQQLGTLLTGIIAQWPQMTEQVKQFGQIWQGVWTNAKAALEPVVRMLIDHLQPALQIVGAMLATIGVGVNAFITAVVGPVTFLSNILDDLAQGRVPRVTLALKAADAAAADAAVNLVKSSEAWQKLVLGTGAAEDGMKKASKASDDMGKSILASGNAVKGAAVNFDAIAKALRALSEKAEVAGLSDTERKVRELTKSLNEAVDSTKGLGAAAAAEFKRIGSEMALTAFQAEAFRKIADEDAKVWLELEKAMQTANETFKITGDQETLFKSQIEATTKALIEQRMKFGELSDEALDFQNRLDGLIAKQGEFLRHLNAVAQLQRDLAASVDTESVGGVSLERPTKQLEDETEAWKKLNIEWREAEALGKVVGTTFDATSAKITIQQQRIQALISQGWDPLGEKVAGAVAELNALKAQKFEEDLAAIAVQAQLLGQNFDGLGATIGVLQQRMRDLSSIKLQTPELQAEIEALANSINHLIDQKRVNDMLSEFTDSFGNALDLVRGTLNTLQQSLSTFFQGGKITFTDFLASLKKGIADFASKEIVGGAVKLIFGDTKTATPGIDAANKASAQVATTMTGTLTPAAVKTAEAMTGQLIPAVTGLADTINSVRNGVASGSQGSSPVGSSSWLTDLGDRAEETASGFANVTDQAAEFDNAWGNSSSAMDEFTGTLSDASTATARSGAAIVGGAGLAVSGFAAAASGASAAAQATGNGLAPAASTAAQALGLIPRVVGALAGAIGGGAGGTSGGSVVGIIGGLVSLFGGQGGTGGGGLGLMDILGLGKTVLGIATELGGSIVQLGNYITTFGAGLVAEGSVFADAVLTTGGAIAGLGDALQGVQGAAAGVTSSLGNIIPVVGVIVGAYSLLSGVYYKNRDLGQGALAGAGLGASIGTLVYPGIGTIIGAAAGALLGLATASGYFPGTQRGGYEAVGNVVSGPLNYNLFHENAGLSPALATIATLLTGGPAGFLGLLGSMFDSQFAAIREKAFAEASGSLTNMSTSFQGVARGGSPSALQAALASTYGPGGAVRVDLNLPPDVAQQLGIAAGTTWAQLSSEQFTKLLERFKTNPELVAASLTGSGDVPYLQGPNAQAVADAAKTMAVQLITVFNAIKEFTDQVTKLSTKLNTAARISLPEDFAGAVKSGMIDPLETAMKALVVMPISADELNKQLDTFKTRAQNIAEVIQFAAGMIEQFRQISAAVFSGLPTSLQATVTPALEKIRGDALALLQSGLDPAVIKERLATLQAEQAALGSLVSSYVTINTEIATMSGNIDAIAAQTMATYAGTTKMLDENLTNAQKALADFGGSGADYATEQALITAVHQAIIDRYEYEIKTIAALEKQIGDVLQSAGTPLATLLNNLAAYQTVTTGSTAQFQALTASYLEMANTAKSTTLQMWALQQGMAAVAAQAQATLVAGIKSGGGTGPLAIRPTATSPGVDVTQLQPFVNGLYDAMAPFIAKIHTLVAEALARNDIAGAVALLQQEQQAVQALAALAINAVNAWADAAIKAVQDFAAEQIKSVTALAKAQTDPLEAQIKANNAIIDATEKAAAAQIKANQSQIDAKNKEIAAIQKAADAATKVNQIQIDAATKQIDAIQKAADIQIKANEKQITATNKQIDAIEKVAAAQIRVNEQQITLLDKQISAIQKAADIQTKANEVQITALERQVTAIQRAADAQIKVNQTQITALDREATEIQRVADLQTKANQTQINALTKEVAAIEKAAAAEIKINETQADALSKQIQAINAVADAQRDANQAQIDSLSDQRDSIQDMIRAAQEWQSVVDSLDKQIKGLLLGPSAPVNPMDQLLMAQKNFQEALANATTPKGVADAQAAADALIKALGAVFARPSLDYQRIFNEVIAQLKGLQTFATGERGGVSLDDLNAQLDNVNAQLEVLQDLNKQIADAAKAQIEPLQSQLDALRDINQAIRDQADTTTGPLKEQIEALQDLNTAIKEAADAQLDPLKAQIQALQDLNTSIKDAADAQTGPMQEQIQALQDLNTTIRDTAEAQIGPMQEQVEALQELNASIRETADAQIEPLRAQVEALQELNTTIKETADAAIEPLRASVDALTLANADIKAAADALIAPLQEDVAALQELNTSIQSQADAITGPLREINTSLGEQVTAINTARDLQIEAINKATADQIDIIEGVRNTQIAAIENGLNNTLTNIAAQMGPLVEKLVGVPLGIEAAMLGNKTATEFLTEATNNAKAALEALNGTLTAYLANLGVTVPDTVTTDGDRTTTPSTSTEWRHLLDVANQAQPGQTWWQLVSRNAGTLPQMSSAEFDILVRTFGAEFSRQTLLDAIHQSNPTWMPTGQHGIWRTKEGPAYLHADEMVLPRVPAESYRQSAETPTASASGVTLNITVNVEGGPVEESIIRRAVKEAVAETETSARIGRLNRIIQEQVR